MSAPAVFGGYTQEELDLLYDTRRRTPDWETYTDRFEERSAAVRERLPDRLDIAYGDHPRQRLDVFHPGGVRRPPVNLFFHGGYWRSGDKERYSYVAEGLLPAGAASVVVEYALCPEVDLDEIVRQCREAVSWVAEHAVELDVDGERLFVSGHSAGGHIVGMVMADWPGAGLVRGGCGISGLYELEPIRLTYLNASLRMDEAMAARNSPALLAPGGGSPVLLAVGGEEGAEFLRQTESMREAWSAGGVPVGVIVADAGNHYSIVESLGDPDDPLTRAIHRQMGLT